jgi:hypothetical protein
VKLTELKKFGNIGTSVPEFFSFFWRESRQIGFSLFQTPFELPFCQNNEVKLTELKNCSTKQLIRFA